MLYESSNEEVESKQQSEEQIIDEMRELVETPVEPVEQEEVAEEPKKYSDAELKAMAMGWKPADKFDKSGKKYLSAEEFIDRGELYDALSHQKKENKQLQQSMKEILELNKRQAELALKDRVNYFKQQRNAAIEIGSKADFEKYDTEFTDSQRELDRISKPQEQQPESQTEKPKAPLHPAAKDFFDRNISWWNDDTSENSRMMNFTIQKERYLHASNPTWSDEKCIFEAERAVRDLFPHRFENVNRTRKPAVNISAPENVSVNASPKNTFNKLPRDVQAAIRPWAEKCGMSLDDYADQLIKEGVIKNVR